MEDNGAGYAEQRQESPMSLASRVVGSLVVRLGQCCPGCGGCGGRQATWCRSFLERESVAEHLWAPFRALAAAPHVALAATVLAYAVYCLLYAVVWVPLTLFLPEFAAWLVVVYGVRRGGHAIARFATFPGSFGTVRGDVEREYLRRLLGRLEQACYALESWWIDLHPRAAVSVDQEGLARHLKDATDARDFVLRPVLDAVDAARGGAGRRNLGDVADLPDLTPRAREALNGFREALAEAVDACGDVERASLDLVACRTRRTVFDDFAHCHYLSSDGAPGVVDPATPLAAVAGRTLFVAHDPK